MRSPAPLPPLSPDERAVVSRVVDSAPPLRAAVVAELAAILRPSDPFIDGVRHVFRGGAS